MASFKISTLALFIFSISCLAEHAPEAGRAAPQLPTAHFGDSLSFGLKDLANRDAKTAEAAMPWLRLYEGGKDKGGKDANSTLNFLKWARGKSKIRPEEDAKAGLILIMRGFHLTPNKDGKTYTLLFLGEFNATKVIIDENTMRDLFAGKQVTWEIKGKTSKTTGVTRYNIETDVTVRVALEGDQLKLYSLTGTGSIETVGFTSTEKFVSPTVQVGDPKGHSPIIMGKKTDLPKLPVLND